jgi:hypothetical protein
LFSNCRIKKNQLIINTTSAMRVLWTIIMSCMCDVGTRTERKNWDPSPRRSDSKLKFNCFFNCRIQIQFILVPNEQNQWACSSPHGCWLVLRFEAPRPDWNLKVVSSLRLICCWRDGRGVRGAKSLVLFLEGGGWCFPSDVQQPSGPTRTHNTSGANCHIHSGSLP